MQSITKASVEGGASGRWLRPTTDKEEYFEVGHRDGRYSQTFYSLNLSSLKPLDENLFRQALVHLYRKVPVLRVCLGRREGRLWLREMEGCALDFKVVTDGVEQEEENKLMEHIYNMREGPLWCVRFLPFSEDLGGVVLLGIHHTVMDGFTGIRISNLLHLILDDLVGERPVDDDEQLGEYVGDEEAQVLYERERQRMLEDSALYTQRKQELMAVTNVRPPLLSVLPSPRTDGKTRSGKLVLDEATTRAFLKTCKVKGVTLHCGLIGVINVALTNMLEALPEPPPEHNFVCSHDINLRRYYKGDTSRILGAHIPLFSYRMCHLTPRNVIHNFWPYVKEIHSRLHTALKEKAPLQSAAVRLMEKSKEGNFDQCFSQKSDFDYSYAISNMGDVTPILPGSAKFVQVRKLTSVAALRCSNVLMCFFVHTLRGQLNITLAYSTRFMESYAVQQVMSAMQDTITSLCQ